MTTWRPLTAEVPCCRRSCRVLRRVHTTPVFTGREHGPRTRVSFLHTREHGPSRSAGAIVNDVTMIFYLEDGCPK